MKKLIYLSLAAMMVLAVSCKKDNPKEPDLPGRIVLTPESPIIIDWDYKFYDNIKDLYVPKIFVDGDRNRLIPCTVQGTWNAKTGFIYTEGMGAVSKHTNDDQAIDVNLVSGAEYGVKDSTYVFYIGKWNEEEGITYFGELNYVVKARPADVTIELDPVEIERSSEFVNIPVSPIEAVYSVHQHYYAGYTFEEVASDFSHKVKKEHIKLTVDGKAVAVSAGCSFASNINKDTSYLYVRPDTPGKWKMSVYTRFANIGYNFVFTLNVK